MRMCPLFLQIDACVCGISRSVLSSRRIEATELHIESSSSILLSLSFSLVIASPQMEESKEDFPPARSLILSFAPAKLLPANQNHVTLNSLADSTRAARALPSPPALFSLFSLILSHSDAGCPKIIQICFSLHNEETNYESFASSRSIFLVSE